MSQTIIVNGATGKFGKILVKNFLKKGDHVVAIGRSIKKLNKLKIYKNTKKQNLILICVDLMEDNAIIRIIKKIKELKLKPDSIINNARNIDYLQVSKNGRTSSTNFINEFKLGVIVPYQLIMSLVDAFPKRFRNVVNIGSIYGSVVPNANLYKNFHKDSSLQYGVTKAALQQLTKELSVRLAKNLVRVNCAAFGGVEGRVNQSFKKSYAKLCPSGRMLKDDEIFGPIEMLISNKASGVSGHVLMIDGGWTVW